MTLVATLALLGLGAAPAAAAQWTAPTSLVLHAAPRAIDPNDHVRFWGQLKSRKSACVAFQRVSLVRKGSGSTAETTVATTTTDAKGRFEFPPQTVTTTSTWQATFGGSTQGTHPNIDTCLGSVSGVLGITVGAGAPPEVAAGLLGVTGSDSVLPFGGLALVLLVSGLTMVSIGRRRRHRAPAEHR